MPDPAPLDDTFRNAIDGNAILFVGSGISYLSKNFDDEALPNGNELRKLLLWKLGITNNLHSLDRLAGHFVRNFGASKLYDLLSRLLKAKEVDDNLSELFRLNWNRIYTTNYDNAIELARNVKDETNIKTLSNSIKNVSDRSIIHINGYIDKVGPHDVATELVLTDASYATTNFANSLWSQLFRSDIQNAKAILFIGYSLYDLDVARILIEDETLRAKTCFIISPNADDVDIGSASQYGFVYAEGFEYASQRLKCVIGSYKPRTLVSAFNFLSEVAKIEDQEQDSPAVTVNNQLIFGQAPINRILNNNEIAGRVRYLVDRSNVCKYIESQKERPSRDVIIVGEIASGKSFASLQIAKQFIKERYTVYVAKSGRGLRQELGELSNNKMPVCVIFDGYRRYIDEIQFYNSQRPPAHRIILTERLVVHEYMERVISEIFPESNYAEIVLDRLILDEFNGFDELINFAGLWGDNSGDAPKMRRRLLEQRYDASLYKLLVELLSSDYVKAEISKLLDPIKDDPDATRLFSTAFIMNVLGHDFQINDWQALRGIHNIRTLMSRYKDSIEHFVTTDSRSIRMRSGLISAIILQIFTTDKTIMDMLVDLYRTSSANSVGNDNFRQIKIDVTRYSSVEPLFHGQNKYATIVNYYETIRPYGDAQNNPDYWLQYGIASTIFGDLSRAEIAFKNAYSRERKKDRPNLVRIDNYFARFQMKKAIEETSSNAAFDIFKSAGDGLNRQIWFDNNRHYPFKTGRAFSEVAAKHFDNWNRSQKDQFILMCKTIRAKAVDWKRTKKKSNPDVDFLIAEIRRLLDRL